jgi:1-deoxy-D-xylulose-5-phosphate synthase
MVVMAPADENECRQMLYTATTVDGPAAVRYPRGVGPGTRIETAMTALPLGRGEIRREGRSGLAILSFGSLLESALAIGERLDATVVNMRFVKPLDEDLVLRLIARHRGLVTVEENAVAGGAGSAVAELLSASDSELPHLLVGIPDCFIEHGSREDCLAAAGLDPAGLQRTIEGWWTAHNSDRARLVGG